MVETIVVDAESPQRPQVDIEEEIRLANLDATSLRYRLERIAKAKSEAGIAGTVVSGAERVLERRIQAVIEAAKRAGADWRNENELDLEGEVRQLIERFKDAGEDCARNMGDEKKREATARMLNAAIDIMPYLTDSQSIGNSLQTARTFTDRLGHLSGTEIRPMFATDVRPNRKADKLRKACRNGATAIFSKFLKPKTTPAENEDRQKSRSGERPESAEVAQGVIARTVGASGWNSVAHIEQRAWKRLEDAERYPETATDEDRALKMGYREARLRLKIQGETINRDREPRPVYESSSGLELDNPLGARTEIPDPVDIMNKVYESMFGDSGKSTSISVPTTDGK